MIKRTEHRIKEISYAKEILKAFVEKATQNPHALSELISRSGFDCMLAYVTKTQSNRTGRLFSGFLVEVTPLNLQAEDASARLFVVATASKKGPDEAVTIHVEDADRIPLLGWYWPAGRCITPENGAKAEDILAPKVEEVMKRYEPLVSFARS